jgi:hypothetical protein
LDFGKKKKKKKPKDELLKEAEQDQPTQSATADKENVPEAAAGGEAAEGAGETEDFGKKKKKPKVKFIEDQPEVVEVSENTFVSFKPVLSDING